MNALTAYLERARNGFSNLTDREKKLVGLLAVVVIGMGLFFIIRGQAQKTHELKQGAQARREAIAQLISKRSIYAQAMVEQKMMTQKLKATPPSVPSFVEAATQQLSIPKATDFRDSHQPVGGRPDVQALSTEISFPEMTLSQLSSLARTIHKKEALLYIQRLRIRGKKDTNTFEVMMQLTTYHQSDKNDEEEP